VVAVLEAVGLGTTVAVALLVGALGTADGAAVLGLAGIEGDTTGALGRVLPRLAGSEARSVGSADVPPCTPVFSAWLPACTVPLPPVKE
jgi:hypothetical protein